VRGLLRTVLLSTAPPFWSSVDGCDRLLGGATVRCVRWRVKLMGIDCIHEPVVQALLSHVKLL
jgi:hypothetical protein